MDLSLILNYLNELSENNNREWYHAHKTDYREANAAFESFIQELIFKIGAFDGSVLQNDPKNLTFKLVRDSIVKNGEEWNALIHDPAFAEYFEVKGTALKNVPAGYDREHPQAEYLKYKSWYLEYPIKDEELINGEAFLEKAFEAFRIMKPFNDFLNRALADFRMPAR